MSTEELISELEAIKNLMVAVSTGGPRIQAIDGEYKQRRSKIVKALATRNLADPNPFFDLWQWYGKWSTDLPSYQDRRTFISNIFQPLIDQLLISQSDRESALEETPTGWERVDRATDKIRQQLSASTEEEDFQQIGLLSRETLISLAQAVYDPETHVTSDGTVPSATDAKRMLEAFILKEFSGGTNEAVRKHARAALDLANDLQHKRTATFRNAAMCAEATMSVVNIIAIASGRRDPTQEVPF